MDLRAKEVGKLGIFRSFSLIRSHFGAETDGYEAKSSACRRLKWFRGTNEN
jgi:hypothetical protein